MKILTLAMTALILVLIGVQPAQAQKYGIYKIDATPNICVNFFDTNGESADPTGTPTVDIYEEDTATEILDNQTLTKFDTKTGLFCYKPTLSAANGFEVGKAYHVTATCDSGNSCSTDGRVITAVEVKTFQIGPSVLVDILGTPAGATFAADLVVLDNFVDDLETRLGTPSDVGGGATIAANLVTIEGQTDDIGAAGAGLTVLATQTSVNTIDDFLDTEAAAILAAVDTEVAAIKAKTDSLTFTTALQLDTQVLSMAANTVTATAIAANAIGASEVADDAVDAGALAADAVAEIKTSIQTGLIYLPKNVAATKIPLIPYDSNGAIIKTAANLSCEGSLDGAAFAALNTPNYVERETGGAQGAVWTFDLIQSETNGKRLFVLCTGDNMVATPVIIEFQQ